VAVAAGVVAALCLVAALLLALVPVQVTAGDLSYRCGTAFSVDGARADDPLCADAVDDRKAWVYGSGALVGLFGLVAVGAIVARAWVDPAD
jgi:hypothetical protein